MVLHRPRDVDFFFTAVSFELGAIAKYAWLVEQHVPGLAGQTQLLEPDVDASSGQHAVADLHEMMLDQMLPQAFRGPILLSLWSVYEAGVLSIAATFQDYSICQNSLLQVPESGSADDDKRRDFLSRVKRYFAQMGIAAFPSQYAEQRMRGLQTVRNALIHGNGLKFAVKESEWRKVEKYARGTPGIEVASNQIAVTADYVRSHIELVAENATHVIGEARDELERHGAKLRD